jgi:hypothetical protein
MGSSPRGTFFALSPDILWAASIDEEFDDDKTADMQEWIGAGWGKAAQPALDDLPPGDFR